MPYRNRPAWMRWATVALAICISAACTSSSETLLPALRVAFQSAEQALRQGTVVDITPLQSYPLYPYLRYQIITRHLPEQPVDDVRAFLKEYADSPLADKLRGVWLRQLFTAQQWAMYLQDAVPTRDPEWECRRRHALLQTAQSEAALQDFATIWMRAAPLPTVCDAVITAWHAQNEPSPQRIWQRFTLVMERYPANPGFAKSLRDALPLADQPLADQWLAIAQDPAQLLQAQRIDTKDPRAAALLNDGLKRWGKRNILAALAALDSLTVRDPSIVSGVADAERFLALWIASDYHPTALARLAAIPDAITDRDTREWRVRLCIRRSDWPLVLLWIDRLSNEEQAMPRWQYWRARALEGSGKTEAAQAIYRTLAGQRDYHGFLAADHMGLPYTLADQPATITAAELETALADATGLQRAQELYVLGREPEADAEWRTATQSLRRSALQQATLLAHRWGWHAQAIATAARATYWDDLTVRFPLPYREEVLARARTETIDPAWAYAIMRQESTFRVDARSSVGALGLMQLMPETGREIARALGEALPDDPATLLQPERNIRYGVHYLHALLDQMQNHPALATAAYNAGPHKVMLWLPEHDPMPVDQWAETIPYRETRAYVQRVMEYAAVYRRRLEMPDAENARDARMKAILPGAKRDG